MVLYVCRHGQTEYNAKGLLQGWFDTPLTAEGIRNAHTLAKKLARYKPGTIFSSDLGRAFMTAYIIGQDLGHTGEIIRATELREVSFGDLAGQPEVEVEDFYQHLQNALTFKPPHGEALGAMQKRVLGFLRDLSKEKQAYTQPLLVT